MKALLTSLDHREPLCRTMMVALLMGVATSIIVLSIQPSQEYVIWAVGNFLGRTGNDLVLILSNLLIIGWAWRKQLALHEGSNL